MTPYKAKIILDKLIEMEKVLYQEDIPMKYTVAIRKYIKEIRDEVLDSVQKKPLC